MCKTDVCTWWSCYKLHGLIAKASQNSQNRDRRGLHSSMSLKSSLTCSTTLLSPSSGSVPFTKSDSVLNSNTPWASSEASIVTRMWDAIPKLAVEFQQELLFLASLLTWKKTAKEMCYKKKYTGENTGIRVLFCLCFFLKFISTLHMNKELISNNAVLATLLQSYVAKQIQ